MAFKPIDFTKLPGYQAAVNWGTLIEKLHKVYEEEFNEDNVALGAVLTEMRNFHSLEVQRLQMSTIVTARFNQVTWHTENTNTGTVKRREVTKTYYKNVAVHLKLDMESSCVWIMVNGGTTGYESCNVESFLYHYKPGEEWCACAGTPDRYDACWIPEDPIMELLRKNGYEPRKTNTNSPL